MELQDGAQLIAQERQRQIEKAGWTPEHDDEHDPGTLAQAGAVYASQVAVGLGLEIAKDYVLFPQAWPFDMEWYKPSDPIRQLVKAGALIAAEIDRLQRLKK